jgi:UDP-N-acetylglucosamine acyltransferase
MIMKGAHIGHDARVGMNVTISPHVCVGGHVTILPFANIGMGAVIHQFQVIGHAAMVGMGSVVTKKSRVMPGEIWAGNPVRHLGLNTKGIIRAGATRETMAYWHELFYNLTKDLK